MLEQILELHKQGRLDEAESRYRELLTFNPDDPETLHLLGILRRQRGDFKEAVQLVRRAIERAPDRYPYYMTLGGMELHLRALDHARADFETAIRLNPNLPSAYSALGHIALLQNDAARAEENFRVALNAGDARIETLSGYGRLLLDRGDVEMALRYLARAAEASPGDAAAQSAVGRAYLAKKMHAFAQRAFENALALKPDFHVARRLLIESLLADRRYADAEQQVRALAAHADQRGSAFALAGDVARARGDIEGALGHYRDAIVARPREGGVVGALAWCLRRLGRHAEAIETWRNYIAEQPGDTDAWRALGGLGAEVGDFKLSREAFGHALAARPDDRESRRALASVLEITGDLDAAEREVDAVLAGGSDAWAGVIKARADLRHGRHEAARSRLAALDLAVLQPPQRHIALALRGLAADAQGDAANAISDWLDAQQQTAGIDRPALPELFAELDASNAAARNAGAPLGEHGPGAFLVGAPGGGTELVAGLLQGIPGLVVAGDRIGADRRLDGFSTAESRYLELDEAQAQVFARKYARGVERLGLPAGTALVDWLPFWDVRFAPAVWRAFGSTRLIVVTRTPREALLQWIALGAAQGYRVHAPEEAARWLERATDHLDWTRASSGLPVLALSADEILADPRAARAQILEFLARSAPAGDPQPLRGLGGLPVALPAGSSARYAAVLRPAFDALASTTRH
jgi:Flp pilus assembly protein TadD